MRSSGMTVFSRAQTSCLDPGRSGLHETRKRRLSDSRRLALPINIIANFPIHIVGRDPRPTGRIRPVHVKLTRHLVAWQQRQLERRQQLEVVAGRSDPGPVAEQGTAR